MKYNDDFEPVPGLPEELPAGESIVWQGAPRWGLLARRAFHIDKLVFYLGGLMIWHGGMMLYGGATLLAVGKALLIPFVLVVAILGFLTVVAWQSAAASLYTITTKRVVMRIGLAMPITVNLPFKCLAAGDLRLNADGSGDITLRPIKGERIAYLALWPHARRWCFSHPEPMLRGINDAEHIAELLSHAVNGSHVRVRVSPATAAQQQQPRAIEADLEAA